jgi:potassium channel subfamily K
MESEGSSHVLSTEKMEEDALRAEENQGRVWFAITAFPLFAGTFGPIASALK